MVRFSVQVVMSTTDDSVIGPAFMATWNCAPLPCVFEPTGAHLVRSFMYLVVLRWSSTNAKTASTGAAISSLVVMCPIRSPPGLRQPSTGSLRSSASPSRMLCMRCST